MKTCRTSGFSLVELMIVVVIAGILAAVALPSYRNHVIRASRSAAQTELLEFASLQEKIYLNSNAYASSVAVAYNGTSAGGLGRTNGLTRDSKYTLSVASPGQTYIMTAAPVAGTTQENDGMLSISESGQRLWGAQAW